MDNIFQQYHSLEQNDVRHLRKLIFVLQNKICGNIKSMWDYMKLNDLAQIWSMSVEFTLSVNMSNIVNNLAYK